MEDCCSICQDNLSNGDKVYLTCGHSFHGQCIVDWLWQQKVCPLCRNSPYSDSDSDTSSEYDAQQEEIDRLFHDRLLHRRQRRRALANVLRRKGLNKKQLRCKTSLIKYREQKKGYDREVRDIESSIHKEWKRMKLELVREHRRNLTILRRLTQQKNQDLKRALSGIRRKRNYCASRIQAIERELLNEA